MELVCWEGLLPCNAAVSTMANASIGRAAWAPCRLIRYCCFMCCRQALLNTMQGMQLRLEGLEDWRGRLQSARLRSPPAEASERMQVGPHSRCRALAWTIRLGYQAGLGYCSLL